MTAKQMKMFWPLFAAACREQGLVDKADKEDYRMSIMWESSRSRHLKDVSPTTGFERLISRVALDSGDYMLASKYTISDYQRIGSMIDDCTRQIFELTTGVKSESQSERIAYVVGILDRSGMKRNRVNSQTWWMDYDSESPIKVFQILDTHRRRLLKKSGITTGLSYRFGREYAS